MTKKTNLQKKVEIQENLTAQNALDEALRLTSYDLWHRQTSMSTANAYNNIKVELLSLQQTLLTYLYKTFGILGKVVDVPVDDAYRYGGFDIQTETINDDELQQLEDIIKTNNDIETLKQARKWARLFGGGALICLDGGDLNKPLNYDKLEGRIVKFVAVDRWQLVYSEASVDVEGGKWTYNNVPGISIGGKNQPEIHASRICLLKGKQAPFIIQQQVQNWGISIYEQIIQDMNQFFKGRNVLFELLDEAKIDVLKIATLKQALSTGNGERAIQRMVDLIARNKNYKGQITLSTEDEYEQKQMTLSGIEGIFREIRVMMAGSANMPVNKLWGEGVTGFGSGEDSLENYNAMIESEIRALDLQAIHWMLNIRSRQLFGRDIEDLEIDWKPLRVLSAIDEQNINDHKVDNLLKLFDRQLLTPQELMEIMKKENILFYNTKAIRGELEDMELYNNVKDTDDTSEDIKKS